MKASLLRSIATSVCVSLFCAPATASAQVTDSLATLQSSLKVGDRLRITDGSGMVTDGKLLGLSSDSIQLNVARGRSFEIAEASLARVERVKRATRMGAIAGFLAGAAAGVLMISADSCHRGCIGPSAEDLLLPIGGLFGGIGAGVGALIGSTSSVHRLVYEHK